MPCDRHFNARERARPQTPQPRRNDRMLATGGRKQLGSRAANEAQDRQGSSAPFFASKRAWMPCDGHFSARERARPQTRTHPRRAGPGAAATQIQAMSSTFYCGRALAVPQSHRGLYCTIDDATNELPRDHKRVARSLMWILRKRTHSRAMARAVASEHARATARCASAHTSTCQKRKCRRDVHPPPAHL